MKPDTLFWWEGTTESALQADIQRLASQGNAAMAEGRHYLRSAACLVVVSNKHERTLPRCYSEQELCTRLEEIQGKLDSGNLEAPALHSWDEHGGRCDAEGKAQLQQHLRAVEYLCTFSPRTPLDTNLLQETYQILMKGAITEDDTPVSMDFRTGSAADPSIGGVHMPAEEVPQAVVRCLQGLADSMAEAARHGPVHAMASAPGIAAKYFVALALDIQPFDSANERLGHLLIAHVFKRSKVPFALSLWNGHPDARTHYRYTLTESSRHGHQHHLRLFILECLRQGYEDLQASARKYDSWWRALNPGLLAD